MFKSLALAISAVTLASAAAADPAGPEDVVALLQSMDSTNIATEWLDDATVRIDANREGYNFTFRLMDCNAEERCVSNMLFATFDMPGAPGIDDYIKINEYNDNYPFGRAFLISSESDEDGYVIGVDYAFITADENKIGEEEVKFFFVILNSFVSHMQEEG